MFLIILIILIILIMKHPKTPPSKDVLDSVKDLQASGTLAQNHQNDEEMNKEALQKKLSPGELIEHNQQLDLEISVYLINIDKTISEIMNYYIHN